MLSEDKKSIQCCTTAPHLKYKYKLTDTQTDDANTTPHLVKAIGTNTNTCHNKTTKKTKYKERESHPLPRVGNHKHLSRIANLQTNIVEHKI